MWNKKTLIGLNKAVTIFNPPPIKNKKNLSDFYNFPLDLFEADIVGFNAISDPFWPKYKNELNYFLDNVSKLAKIITCVTKFPVTEKVFKKLAKIKNFLLVVSITGLDNLENTNTKSRLNTLKLAKKYHVKAFPLIHPYIPHISDLSFLKKLKKMGYKYVDIKGLRYNQAMNSWMPRNIQKYYKNTKEKEILPKNDYKIIIKNNGLEILSLKKWYKIHAPKNPSLNQNKAKENVNQILKYANITSSDTNKAVIKASIQRKI
jgi:DNA repair photolyase